MPFTEIPPDEMRPVGVEEAVATFVYSEARELFGNEFAQSGACSCADCNRRREQLEAADSSLQVASNTEAEDEDGDDFEECSWCDTADETVRERSYITLCQECWNEVALCTNCDCAMHEDDAWSVEIGPPYSTHTVVLCEGCRDELAWCEACELYYWGESTAFNEYDQCEYCDEEGIDDDDSDGGVHSWNYRPEPEFVGKDEGFHFGVEIEMDHVAARDVVEHLYAAAPITVYCKHDGSLRSGVEVVTHPGTLAAWQNGEVIPWDEWQSAAEGGLFGEQQSETSAGIHVHLSRTAFDRNGKWSASHAWKFMQLHYRNEVAFQRLSGRPGSGYASWKQLADRKEATPKAKAARGHGHDRYSVLNFNNRETVECRYFQSDERKEIILKNIELIHAAVEYTRGLSAKAVKDGLLDYKHFREWFASRGDRYPHLVLYAEEIPELVKLNRDHQRKVEREVKRERIREIEQQRAMTVLYARFGLSLPGDLNSLYWDRLWGGRPSDVRSWFRSRDGQACVMYALGTNSPNIVRALGWVMRDAARRYIAGTFEANGITMVSDDEMVSIRAWHGWDIIEAMIEVYGFEPTSLEMTMLCDEVNVFSRWN